MIQTSLFDTAPAFVPPPPASTHPRAEQIERAFERASDEMVERYEAIIRVVGDVRDDFIAGDITDRYEQRYGKLEDHEKKALGGLYQRLIKSGVIEKTGKHRARNQGNLTAVYRLVNPITQ